MITKKTIQSAFLATLFLIIALPAYCCEPMVPLGMAFGGANWIMGSAAGLLIAIAIKCISFPFFAKDVRKISAVILMFQANIVTGIIGVLLVISVAAPVFSIFFIPLVFVISLRSAKRIWLTNLKPLNSWNPALFASILTVLWIGSGILYIAAQGAMDTYYDPGRYWLFKVLYVYLGLLIGFALTTLWEEGVISYFLRAKETSYLNPVIKSNLLALLAVSLIGAGIMLPERLRSSDFIVHLINFLGF